MEGSAGELPAREINATSLLVQVGMDLFQLLHGTTDCNLYVLLWLLNLPRKCQDGLLCLECARAHTKQNRTPFEKLIERYRKGQVG